MAVPIDQKVQKTRRAFERLRDHAADPLCAELVEMVSTIEELEVAAEELRLQGEEHTSADLAVEGTVELYHHLFDEAPSAFVVTDSLGAIREANKRMASLLCVAQQRLISKPLSVFVVAEERRAFRQLVNSVSQARGLRRVEMRLQPRAGPSVPAMVEVGAIGGERSDEVRLYWVVHDLATVELGVAELESALAREKEASKRLFALDEMKNELIEDLSHDLRNPLTAILGFVRVLQGAEVDGDRARDLLGRLAENAQRLERYMSQLLEFDEKTRGFRSVHRQAIDVAALATMLAREWTSDDHPVTVDAEPTTVKVEPALVERILENLIVNALKHSPSGGAVSIEVRRSDGGVLMTVGDSGPGVADEFKPRVFSRYFRLPGTEVPGTGVGLHLVARLSSMHGGRVWV